MRDKILAFCRAELHHCDTVYCAVSGGADSISLLHCMHSLQADLGISVKAAHFNHCLRGEESDLDEAFVRTFCAEHNIEFCCERGDTAARVASSDDSLEEAARRLRYAFFDTLPGYVLTAHTADDNLETLLINLIRGTSLAGLGGIPPKRGRILRPMLQVSREEVLAYLQQHGLSHREDASNALDAHLRNRLRHHVLPLLKAENPSLLDSVSALTHRLRLDEELLLTQAKAVLDAAQDGDGWLCSRLASLPEPILHRAAIELLANIPDRTSRHVEALCALIRSDKPSAHLDLPGERIARREYDELLLQKAEYPSVPTTPLCIPGITKAGQWQITCTLSDVPTDGLCLPYREDAVYFVRARQTGDRLTLRGGSKTIKDLMIDRKIPAARRDSIPVLCDKNGPVALWGVAADIRKTSGEEKTYLSISMKEIFD